tara:strand:+ start:239 stop:400 length:162 start_codon:yes stop_codon:yes gene_type:complete
MMVFLNDHAGLIGLLFFVVTFLSICFWALRPSAKHKIESYKFIPLEEADHELK